MHIKNINSIWNNGTFIFPIDVIYLYDYNSIFIYSITENGVLKHIYKVVTCRNSIKMYNNIKKFCLTDKSKILLSYFIFYLQIF